MSAEYRPYRPEDRAGFVSLVQALYREDPQGEAMTDRKIDLTLSALSENPGKGTVVLFDVAGQLVGYSILIKRWSNEHGGDLVVIDEIYVKPGFRGRGIASALLDRAAALTGSGAQLLMLEVTPGDRSALAYSERRGFVRSKNHHLFRPTRP